VTGGGSAHVGLLDLPGPNLEAAAKIVILDEPLGASTLVLGIYDVIVDLAKQGMAVIVVSSELEEVLGLSHRVLILARGKSKGILDRTEATDVAVMHLATA
jgi:ribose transport system ATP-binding protein